MKPTTTRWDRNLWDRNLPKIVENPGFFFLTKAFDPSGIWGRFRVDTCLVNWNPWKSDSLHDQMPNLTCYYVYVQYIYRERERVVGIYIYIYTVYKYIEHSAYIYIYIFWLDDNIPPSWIFLKKLGIPHTQTLLSASCGCCEKPRCPDEECQQKTTLWVPIVKSVAIIWPEKMDAV